MEIPGLEKNKDDSLIKNERTMEVENNIDLKTSRFTVSNRNDPFHVKTKKIEESSGQNEVHEIKEHFSIKNETDLLSGGADELTFGDFEIVSSINFGKDELRGMKYDVAKGLTFKDYECIPMQIVSNTDVLVKTETIEETSAQNEVHEIKEHFSIKNETDLLSGGADELTFGDYEIVSSTDFGKDELRGMNYDGAKGLTFKDYECIPLQIVSNRDVLVMTETIEETSDQNEVHEIKEHFSIKNETDLFSGGADELTFGDFEFVPTKKVMREMDCDETEKSFFDVKRIFPTHILNNRVDPLNVKIEIIEESLDQNAREIIKDVFLKNKTENVQKFPEVANKLTPGEYGIVSKKDPENIVLKIMVCDEVKELTYCDCEHCTTKHETSRDRNLRLNRERSRRWKSRQSKEQLQKMSKVQRMRRQEKMKLLREMEINT